MTTLIRTAPTVCALVAALLGTIATPCLSQKATEMFIPVGQSVGLSGKHTLLAAVQSVDEAQRSVTLVKDGTSHTVKLGAKTPVWLDRSKMQKSNAVGALGDVKPGMTVEVKFQKNNRAAGDAEWVKLQMAP
ncbi:MAG: hypothetical protein ABL900_13270 [Burkholderiaceae bacterium]